MMLLQRAARRLAGVVGRDSAVARAGRPVYEHALAWMSAGRGVPWTINGADFRISPFERHRMGQTYDPEVAAYLRAHVRPGARCFDVGANVGVYALQFARWAGRTGRVVAFEPNPLAAATLGEHVRMNHLQGRVRIVQAAVADLPGVRTFHMAEADGMSRLGQPNPEIAARTRPVPVQVTTIDAYCSADAAPPDWLMIDVEGFEFAVLSGARRTIAGRQAGLNIVVEMHPDAWSVAGWTRQAGEALLKSLGAEAIGLSGQADPLGAYGHVLLSFRPGGRAN